MHKGSNFPTFSSALVFLIAAILMGMGWYPIVVLVCISLMISDVEHLFLCSLVIHISFFEECQVLCPFLNWIVYFLVVEFGNQFFWHLIFSSSPILTLWFIFLILLHWIKLAVSCWKSDSLWAHLLYLWISYYLLRTECMSPLRICMLRPQTSMWQHWQALKFRSGHGAGASWWD